MDGFPPRDIVAILSFSPSSFFPLFIRRGNPNLLGCSWMEMLEMLGIESNLDGEQNRYKYSNGPLTFYVLICV